MSSKEEWTIAGGARERLKDLGYLDDSGNFNFGDADSHLLRALYVVAINKRILGPKETLTTVIKEFQGEDVKSNWNNPPPWK
jgi:hypothetical protein